MTSVNSVTCAQCGQPASGNFCNGCGAPLQEQPCPRCQARLSPGARFCHLCGTPLGRADSREGGPLVKNAGWIAAGLVTVVLVVVASVRFSGAGPVGQTATAARPTAPILAPDISNMSPRERADRLFDRVIFANERGLADTVAFFTPMALDAYRMLGTLDTDARYHVGLIHALAGNLGAVRAQLDTLQTQTPDHLLGFMLAYAYANLTSDDAGMRQAHGAFLEAYEEQIATGLPELTLHVNAIDAFRAEALDGR